MKVSAKKVAKVAKKPRRNNIRGGTFLSTKLSPIQEERKVELQRASLSLPPPTRFSVSASQSLRPLPVSVSPLSSVSSSASGSAKRYRRTGKLLTLPKPPLTEKAKEAERLNEAAAIADREAREARERRIAREAKEKEELRIAVEEAVRRSKDRGNRGLLSFANLSPEEKLEIFASNYMKLKAGEEMSGVTLTRERDYNSKLHKRQNEVLNGLRSS